MIVVAEPNYRDGEHASVNGNILSGIAANYSPTLFASTPLHRDMVQDGANPFPQSIDFCNITVMPPGGVKLRRIWAQWTTLMALMHQHSPHTLVLLSTGPETLFAVRALVTRFPTLQVYAVMHGNINDALGWRSRDPRRRLIDMRSGLRVGRHPRIHLIALEEHIRAAAARLGFDNTFLVWPLPISSHEVSPVAPWMPGPKLRLAFIGTGHRNKGFDEFLTLHSAAGPLYDWSLIGRLGAEYAPDQVVGIERPAGFLSRPEFVRQVRQADYAIAHFPPHYELTASGSLLDCVAQCKPIIAVETPVLAGLAQRYGKFGYLCPDVAATNRLLLEPERLRDRAAYAKFQANLDTMRRERIPEVLAQRISQDLHLPAPGLPRMP